ncbi:MAG: class I adenylate-forming enzyme family protein [Noviherbaspirillum sp.]
MTTILTLHDPAKAAALYASGAWQKDTLYTLLARHAAERPLRHALRDHTRRLTWAELLAWTDTVAAELESAGLRRGSRVSVWLPNRVESVVVFLACSRNGYICNVSLHQNYTVAEIVTLLDRIECEAFFGQAGYGADAAVQDAPAAIGAVSSLKRAWWLAPRGSAAAQAAFPATRPERRPCQDPDANPDKITYLAFTSGTTGVPKAVMHSDNTLLANGRAMVTDWNHDENTILLSLSPVSHHIATVGLEQALAAGCEMVLNDPAPGMKPLDWILETGATYVMGVPTHAMDILAEAKRRGIEGLGRVKLFYMAGAAIPPEVAQSFLARGVMPQNIYGMTENGSHQYTLPTDDVDTIVNTCGRACHGFEVKLWNQDNPDIEAAPGELGEIGSRGGNLMLGYFGNQPATEKSFNASGWFLSGDLGRFDSNGCLVIVGRKKDLIIRGGHNIYPASIEDRAISHPLVLKAAAFPVADPRLGEKVCLAVITADGAQLDGGAMLQHLHEAGLSKFDMPEYFLAMEEFPLTASGKILKRELVEQVRQGRIAPAPVRWTGGRQ